MEALEPWLLIPIPDHHEEEHILRDDQDNQNCDTEYYECANLGYSIHVVSGQDSSEGVLLVTSDMEDGDTY